MNRVNSTYLTCNAPLSRVEREVVTVWLAGQNSTDAVFIDRLCGANFTARPGQNCSNCPVVSGFVCVRVCVDLPSPPPGNDAFKSLGVCACVLSIAPDPAGRELFAVLP